MAQKLADLTNWIKGKKDGLLTSKPYVLDLLTEIILDTQLWLLLKPLSQEQRQRLYLSENKPITEQYWLEVLFPRWINDQDPKFPNWRREVMKGNFQREDELILKNLAREIKSRGGSYLWRHLLDLSMATDLLALGQSETPLCVQLTTVSGSYLTDKQQGWEATLNYWHIERGLLISYNSRENSLMSQLVTVILRCSDTPTMTGYNVVTDITNF
ncbi:MAG: hypothetical protein WBA43_13180 [Elainellaceae cyanobacterium]